MKHTVKQSTLRVALAAALAAVTLSSQAATSASAQATGEVLAPISITKSADLSFGKFVVSTGGSITVATDGSATSTGIIRSTAFATTAAQFDVSGAANATYTIDYTGTSTTLASGANTMALDYFSATTASSTVTNTEVATGTLGAGGTQSIYVGGILTVGATQAVGTYTGTIAVAVQYN